MNSNVMEVLRSSPGHTQATAYDTAWTALLSEYAPDLAYPALQWLCSHQNPDGSWGAAWPVYYHDRVVSTLIALIVLSRCGRRVTDRLQIDIGMQVLADTAKGTTPGLYFDPHGATAGFEMIVPFLLTEAELLGLLGEQSKQEIMGRLEEARSRKVEILQGRLVNRHMPLAFSAEMAGWENWESMLDSRELREPDGSIAHSPSATAYYAWAVKPGDKRALAYLRKAVLPDYAFSIAHPFEIYEIAWVLWNLSLLPGMTELPEYQRHLEKLRQAWQPGKGVGFTRTHPIPDGDDTAIVAFLFGQQGDMVDTSVFKHYIDKECFRCFPMEIDHSVSTNVHFLLALRQAGYSLEDSYVQRILRFLNAKKEAKGYWKDKWHVSPYYTTSHAIIACAGYCEEMVQEAVHWILASQDKEGGWGYLDQLTAEETAYSLQALAIWRQHHRDEVPAEALQRGKAWLLNHASPPYPPLWIAKSLYVSHWVVQAEITSALGLVEEVLS